MTLTRNEMSIIKVILLLAVIENMVSSEISSRWRHTVNITPELSRYNANFYLRQQIGVQHLLCNLRIERVNLREITKFKCQGLSRTIRK